MENVAQYHRAACVAKEFAKSWKMRNGLTGESAKDGYASKKKVLFVNEDVAVKKM